jgi:hypothetical protein
MRLDVRVGAGDDHHPRLRSMKVDWACADEGTGQADDTRADEGVGRPGMRGD